ncbi:MAG: TonB-dependent receptor [Acidobacteria bacterium]|nr:TonB-dependent receptor [Acidobacteriota bacterium]
MPTLKRIGAAAVALSHLAALAPVAEAQVATVPVAVGDAVSAESTLSGVVQDPRGLPLLGAFVAVIALGADEPTAVVVTDGGGKFSVGNLPQGMYSLLVGSLGFAGTVLQGISVPSTVPVTLQLEPEEQRTLSAFDAPLDLGYALRSSKRDVLRQTDTTIVTADGTAAAPRQDLSGAVAPSLAMGGEVRLWSFTNVGSSSAESETVGVTTVDLRSGNLWDLRAHVGHEGAVWAASNLRQDLGGGHSLRVGFGYVGGGFQLQMPEEAGIPGSWIGRLLVEDTWQASDPLEVRYGVRYEHHNYLGNSELVSPAFELAYELVDNTRLTTGVAMNTTGLGLADDNGFEVMSVINKANVRVNDTSQVVPERALRYHFGVEQYIGPAAVSVRAYYDDVTNQLLGVYLSGDAGQHNYLFFNVGDSAARGVELGVAGQIADAVSGQVTYAYRDRDAAYTLPMPTTFGVGQAEDLDRLGQQTHEVNATLAAQIPTARTFLEASYSWRHGMPVVRDGEIRPDVGRFDFRVRQPLPFRALQTEWSAMLQVRNLLGPQYDGLYDVTFAELVGLTRGIAGGLAVSF